MRITRRITNSKRHTVGYTLDGIPHTRGEVVKMARRGKINTVIAKKGPQGWYVTTIPSADRRNLYELPVVVRN